MYAPWLAHHYPGVTLDQLLRGYWTLAAIVAMHESVRSDA